MAESYINESISIYDSITKKIKSEELNNIKNWVKNIKSENQYSHIDNLFSDNILAIESKINSKKLISESLKKEPKPKKDTPKVPIKSIISIANKTITNHVNNLSESDKKELVDLLSQDDNVLKKNFEPLKSSVISKLTSLSRKNTDYQTSKKINETIEKVKTEKYDKLTYFKLKGLNENL